MGEKGTETDVPSGRCGYTHELRLLEDMNLGAVTCWRPTWDDHDRCIWHADEEYKPLEEFEKEVSDDPKRLDGAIISNLDLDGVDWFEECVLVGAEFTDVDLRDASLQGSSIQESVLENVDARRADFEGANFEDAVITSSDLRSACLVEVRFDQAVLTNVRINRQTDFGRQSVYEQDLSDTDQPEVDINEEDSYLQTAQAAIWGYREIQKLHRENALPLKARHYYYKEKNLRRRVAWRNGSYLRALKAEGSRWVTGYGMNPWRVIGTALGVIVLCAIAYPLAGGIQETVVDSVGPVREAAQSTNATNVTEAEPSTKPVTVTWSLNDVLSAEPQALLMLFLRSLYFSAITFTTLGYGDIAPVGNVARTIAGLESLAGAVLTALLVFVLSRRIS